MKPVGLRDPRTGQTPWAVVQLRKENLRADSYNLVGFQNHLKLRSGARFAAHSRPRERAISALWADSSQYIYLCAMLLDESLALKTTNRKLMFAGQLSGVEGYTESIATGYWPVSLQRLWRAANNLSRSQSDGARIARALHHPRRSKGLPARQHHFRPAGAVGRKRSQEGSRQKERHRMVCDRSLAAFDAWWSASAYSAFAIHT